MFKHALFVSALSLLVFGGSASSFGHCQVPCGIYDDEARIHAMQEDVATIAKAVEQIQKLAPKSDAQSRNQTVRWIQTKETHASRIIKTTAEYFLTQKLKPASPEDKKAYRDYVERLKACHAVMRAAMKAKQTVDSKKVLALRAAVDKMGEFWHPKQ